MKRQRSTVIGLGLAVIALAVMCWIEQVKAPSYFIKSIWKASLFLGAIIIYKLLSGESIADIIHFKKMKKAKVLYLGMAGAYIGIIVLFLLLRNMIDLENIRANLLAKENLTRDNFLYVFIYIIICNSFLEEAFFRGFIFHLLEKLGSGKISYMIGGLAFALYHIGIVTSWFSPFIFVLCIGGLALVGVMLQLVCNHYDSLKASWLIHACANLAINTIGTIMILGL